MYALRQDFTPQKECVKVLHRAQELAVEHKWVYENKLTSWHANTVEI